MVQALLDKNKNVKPWNRVVMASANDINNQSFGWPNATHDANKAIPPTETAMMEKALAEFHFVLGVPYSSS